MYNTPVNPFFSWRSQLTHFFRSKSVLSILVIINVAVWFVLALTNLVVYIGTLLFKSGFELKPFFVHYLGYPADYWSALIHPWSIVTSLFLHEGFWSLLCNIILLLFAGHIYRQYKSGKSLLFTYILGGVCGNLLFQSAYHIVPALMDGASDAFIIGSTSAVLALLTAVAFFRPNHPIRLLLFGQLRLKWVALILIVLIVLAPIDGDFKNIGSFFAHLGGIMYGAGVALWSLYGQKLKSPKPKKKKHKFYTSYQAGTPEPAQQQDDEDERRLETILDKIAQNGYEGLSKEEKDFFYNYRKN